MIINQAPIWSDEVRDSRNVLHFAKLSAVPLTYEPVAMRSEYKGALRSSASANGRSKVLGVPRLQCHPDPPA
jgi:hypothetical protein